MSNVAARQPFGNDRISADVASNVPHAVGKSLALIPDCTRPSSLGNDSGLAASCLNWAWARGPVVNVSERPD
jgi:hypothetical protein